MEAEEKHIQTCCCIAGGGPAGMMLGLLLAKAGIDVVVIEKWGDFLRDFRGDTIHPSTMEVLDELGLLDEFLALKPNRTNKMTVFMGGKQMTLADFTHLPVKCPYIAFIPQSDFLEFISSEAKKYSNFKLLMNTEATGLIEESGVVKGIKAKNEGNISISAELTIGADGRHSTIRNVSGFKVKDFGAPVDVLWFRVSRNEKEDLGSAFYADDGNLSIILNRGSYWQCGFIVRKNGVEELKQKGIDSFRKRLSWLIPPLQPYINEIQNWEQIKLLSVAINHLDKWHKPGLICIGDAAHAMSPMGGVGINLAIQDAVATANIIIPALKQNKPLSDCLAAIQKRRSKPAIVTQRMQVFLHKFIMTSTLEQKGRTNVPLALRLSAKFPLLNRIPARLVGIGLKPEHIEFLN